MHLAVAILRVEKGLDYTHILGDDLPISIYEIPKTLQSNDSSAELKIAHTTIHGSCDSLSRNGSQGNDFNYFRVFFFNYIHKCCTYTKLSKTNIFEKKNSN